MLHQIAEDAQESYYDFEDKVDYSDPLNLLEKQIFDLLDFENVFITDPMQKKESYFQQKRGKIFSDLVSNNSSDISNSPSPISCRLDIKMQFNGLL